MDGVRDLVAEAVAEARRRQAAAVVDLAPTVDHLAATLPAVVAELGLRVDGWFGHSLLPVLAVTTADGRAAVLKVRLPGELTHEATVLAAGPAAYAAVLGHDHDRGLLLTERLGEHLGDRHPDLVDQLDALGPLLRRAWQVPVPPGVAPERKAERLVEIVDDLGPRFAAAHPDALARARGLAGELARDEAAQVLCHGDPHAGNVLARDGGWAFVDPDGLLSEGAYDVGVVLRDAGGAHPDELRELCTELARLSGVDPERAWAWAEVERVTTGLYLHWFGRHEEAERYLAFADLLLG